MTAGVPSLPPLPRPSEADMIRERVTTLMLTRHIEPGELEVRLSVRALREALYGAPS